MCKERFAVVHDWSLKICLGFFGAFFLTEQTHSIYLFLLFAAILLFTHVPDKHIPFCKNMTLSDEGG